MKDNVPLETAVIPAAPGGTHTFSATGPGRYRLEFHADGILLSHDQPHLREGEVDPPPSMC